MRYLRISIENENKCQFILEVTSLLMFKINFELKSSKAKSSGVNKEFLVRFKIFSVLRSDSELLVFNFVFNFSLSYLFCSEGQIQSKNFSKRSASETRQRSKTIIWQIFAATSQSTKLYWLQQKVNTKLPNKNKLFAKVEKFLASNFPKWDGNLPAYLRGGQEILRTSEGVHGRAPEMVRTSQGVHGMWCFDWWWIDVIYLHISKIEILCTKIRMKKFWLLGLNNLLWTLSLYNITISAINC